MLPAWPPSPANIEAAIHPLAVATSLACGGKARNLAKLIAAGLPVPDGFVVDDSLFRAGLGELRGTAPDAIGHVMNAAAERLGADPSPTIERWIRERAAGLGDQLAVRSSSTIEDRVAGAAAGVFASTTGLAPQSLWSGIVGVWMSALTPLAASYARAVEAHGIATVAVIVQRFVAGTKIVVYTRPPGRPTDEELLVQRGDDLTRMSRASDDAIALLALRAEVAIGSSMGADVELVEGADGLVVVQARPIVHRVHGTRLPPPPIILAPLVADGREWTWDIAHNPDPLSTAQTELVELVERAKAAPYSLRVCAGFLYSAPREDTATTAAAYDALAREPQRLLATVREIEARIAFAIETISAGAERDEIDDARARYVAFYELWARELSPIIAALKRAATVTTSVAIEARPSSVEATLLAAARGEIDEAELVGRLGSLAPAWDVAAATYAERPALLHEAVDRAKRAGIGRRTTALESGTITALAAELAERDDQWFAEAQWVVRRAYLGRAAQLGVDPDDIFWLPLDDIAMGVSADDARRRAAGSRAAAARAARWAMPIMVGCDPARPEMAEALRGIGSGRAQGRVVKFATLASAVAVGAGDVIVTRSVTPALAVMVVGCAALVSETGGLLDHAAAMARELGIPCVVGCVNAWAALEDGMVVEVDGDAGRVTVVTPTAMSKRMS